MPFGLFLFPVDKAGGAGGGVEIKLGLFLSSFLIVH